MISNIKIDIKDIDSSNIKNILFAVYDESDGSDLNSFSGTLAVTFQNDKIYKYINVKMVDVVSCLTASSIGTGFNKHIKSNYNGRLVLYPTIDQEVQ